MDEKIILKLNWDYQYKIKDSFDHHITRESEHRILFDFIFRRVEGSMLVCGQRGVGKTSSVFKAVKEAIKSNEKIYSVLIKATSIDLDEKNDQKRNILRSLIRSLYRQIRDEPDIVSELKERTSKLYNKAMASQIKHENQLDRKSVSEKIFRTHIRPIPVIVLFIVGIISSLGIFPEYSLILSSILIGSGAWLLVSYSKVVKKSSVNMASYYYRYDYDFSTMQSEFELLLEKFAEKKVKILFILDELDKVGNNSFSIILNLKMLINQGNALFIFITDPKILDSVKDKKDPNSTLFSQILYLKRPLFEEMRRFLAEIILNDSTIIQKTDYKNFQNFLCYQSKTDFFDLHNVIRDNIIGTNPKGQPILKFNLNSEQITKANLQKSIEWIYEREKGDTPSRWEANDEMLKMLYLICAKLESIPRFENIKIKQFFESIKPQCSNTSRLDNMIVDLFEFLKYQNYLRRPSKNTYQIIGQLQIIKKVKGEVFVGERQKFKEEYEKVLKLAINIVNVHNAYLQDLDEVFSLDTIHLKWTLFGKCIAAYFDIAILDNHRKIYVDLIENDPVGYSPEKLQKMTLELQNEYKEIKQQFVNLLAAIFHKKINDLQPGQTRSDISQGVFVKSGVPNTDFNYHEMSFNDSNNHKLQHIVITENICVGLIRQLLRRADQNILIVSLGSSEDNSEYKSRVTVLAIETFRHDIDRLDKHDKKYLFLPITVPIQLDELKEVLKALQDYA